MAAKNISMSIVKQIFRLKSNNAPIKSISRITGVSRNTVRHYLQLQEESGHEISELLNLDDVVLQELFAKTINVKENDRLAYFEEKFEYWIKELNRVGVTRYLLWQEYRLKNPGGYSYTQFCHHLHLSKQRSSSSMIIEHLPGKDLYIDFTGKKMSYYDALTGEEKKVEILIGCLGYSQKGFMIALPSQKSEDFIYAMSLMLRQIGGVPQAIVPDNMKTAVIKSDRYEPEINQILSDFANHYSTAIVPTRALHPKDKALAENLVKMCYSRVFAPLRDEIFTSIESLNEAIQKHINIHNQTPFQKKNYSRNDLFDAQEKNHLGNMPLEDFRIKKYRQYTVQKNSHIILTEDNHYYSVPYAYLGQKVDVIYTHTKVMVYAQNKQIAQHNRTRLAHGYTTIQEHLPSKYNDYKDRSPTYYKQRAEMYHAELKDVITKVLMRKLLPEQNYKSCDGILRLAKNTPDHILKNACKIALIADSCHYRFIDKIIRNGVAKNYAPEPELKASPEHTNIRGKEFFKQLTQIFK